MASGAPIHRQVSWLIALPLLLVLGVAAALGQYLGGTGGMLLAQGCVLGYAIAARSPVARGHRAGIRLVRRGRFSEAIPHFERSFAFFDRRRGLDAWRGIVMLSASRASYREMALLNAAFCLGQVGEGERAIATYRRCLQLFPDSGMADAATRILEAARSTAQPGA